jgi:hypothetical protein
VALEFEQIAVLNSSSTFGRTVTCLVKAPACVREMTLGRISDGVVNCRFFRELRMVEIIIRADSSPEFEIDFVVEFDADPASGLHLPGTATATLAGTLEECPPGPAPVDFSEITRRVSGGAL